MVHECMCPGRPGLQDLAGTGVSQLHTLAVWQDTGCQSRQMWHVLFNEQTPGAGAGGTCHNKAAQEARGVHDEREGKHEVAHDSESTAVGGLEEALGVVHDWALLSLLGAKVHPAALAS